MRILSKVKNVVVSNENGFSKSIDLTHSSNRQVTFPYRSPKQRLYLENDQKTKYIDLIYYDLSKTKQIKLIESRELGRDTLANLIKEFSMVLDTHPLSSKTQIALIPGLPKKFRVICFAILCRIDNQKYITIYTSESENNFEDNIIFIYGIWEVDNFEYLWND